MCSCPRSGRTAGCTPDLGDSILADPRLAPLATLPDGVRTLAALRHLTRINLSRGAQVIKTRANPRAGLPEQDPLEPVYDVDQIRAVVAEAARKHAPVMCHAYSPEGCEAAVRGGVASLEHGVFVSDETLALMTARGVAFTPTMTAIAGLADSDDPVLAERGRRFLPALEAAVRSAHARGVPVVAGTDTFGADTTPIGVEVGHLHDAGLSTLDALRASTTTAASLLRLPRAGHLRPGAFADVIAVDGNPLDDITALQRLRLVIACGALARNDLPA